MNQLKPVIGITVSSADGRLYLSHACEKAVLTAGGLPVLLPIHIAEADSVQLLQHCDGVLFSGGIDVDPALYGEDVLESCGAIDPERDSAEILFFKAARALHLPIFGICRGHQLINVLMGGDLCQDIVTGFPRENALQHCSKGASDSLLHGVEIQPGSLLARAAGGKKRIRVTSTHHQAIRTPAPEMLITGMSADGIAEAMEYSGEDFISSVQWHPELLYQKDDCALKLLQQLVSAAQAYREGKQ